MAAGSLSTDLLQIVSRVENDRRQQDVEEYFWIKHGLVDGASRDTGRVGCRG